MLVSWQWQHDQAALTDEVKAVLEHRDAGSQHQNSGPNAAQSQQQVYLVAFVHMTLL